MTLILGLDVGDKRVGIAIGESESKLATPYGAVDRAKGKAEIEILALCKERNISKIVAGLPLDYEGRLTEQALKIQSFCRRLSRRAPLEIVFVDETLTTESAKQRLEMSVKKTRELRQKGVLDAVSASIILEVFFASVPTA